MKTRAIVAAVVMAASLMLCTSGCDNRPCLQGHYDYMPVMIGKTLTVEPIWECDVYGKAPKNG